MNLPSPSLRAAPAVLLALASAAARAQDPAPASPVTILDEQLDPRRAALLSIDERHVIILDEQSQRRVLARHAVLAILSRVHDEPDASLRTSSVATDPGLLELTDGQRFPGDLLTVDHADDAVAWNHPAFGRIDLPIDRVLQFWRAGAPFELRSLAPNDADTPAADILFLINGDQQSGYLASAGNPVRLDIDGAPLIIDPDRVAGARLSNSPVPAEGTWIWLTDGTAARLSLLDVDTAGRSSCALDEGPTGSLRWDQVRAVLLHAERIIPLSTLTPIEQSPAEGRRYAPPIREHHTKPDADPLGLLGPAMAAADLILPGPMSVTWSLPERARRLAFTAALAHGAIPWGDCELIVSIDGVEQARRHINPDQASVHVSLPLTGRTLTIATIPGRFGPIRDWIILERPLILVAESKSSAD